MFVNHKILSKCKSYNNPMSAYLKTRNKKYRSKKKPKPKKYNTLISYNIITKSLLIKLKMKIKFKIFIR